LFDCGDICLHRVSKSTEENRLDSDASESSEPLSLHNQNKKTMSLFGSSVMGALSGFTRSPLVTRWRNQSLPRKLDRSNKGKQNWYKGRGVGLHGALNKQGLIEFPSGFRATPCVSG
jgi:hypothetical protein